MATNKKHIDSKKYNKALTFEERISLDKIISTNRDKDGSFKLLLNSVGDMLEKDPSTLSKEVKNRRSTIQSKTYCYAGSYCYQCAKNKTCIKQDDVRKGQLKCMEFEQMICKYLKKFPWVCNGCCKSGVCRLPKSYYNPKKSQTEYESTLTDCREGINMTLDEFKAIDNVVSTGLQKGQSPEHIIHSNNLPISLSFIYKQLHKGYFTADKFNTHRMLRLRPRANKRANSILLRQEKAGKYYNDFLNLLKNDPSLTFTEMDTLVGKRRDSKYVLSLHIPKIKFQFYFLLDGKDATDVTNKLNEIESIIGIDNYKKIFGVILTDNGTEFTDIRGIEMDPDTGEVRTNLYFCHPGASGEKGSCERNHELFRYILPKGTSFEGLTQEHFNLITSHVNSYKRKSTDYSSPIELFRAYFGPEILDKLNISLVEPNSVTLTSELLKKVQ